MGRERVYGLWIQRSHVWERGPLPTVKEMAKIVISRSGTNSLRKFAVSYSNPPVAELRKEKRIQSWSLEIKNLN